VILTERSTNCSVILRQIFFLTHGLPGKTDARGLMGLLSSKHTIAAPGVGGGRIVFVFFFFD